MNNKAARLCLAGIFVALITVCAYLHIPFFGVNLTLQTFALYLCLFVLGERLALGTVLAYILTGLIGIPVFSGFTGGLGALFGSSGGFILGFLPSLFLSSRLTKVFGTTPCGYYLSALCSLPVCYLTGTLWFAFVYLRDFSPSGLLSAFTICALPFIIPDALKLFAASVLGVRINKIIKKDSYDKH